MVSVYGVYYHDSDIVNFPVKLYLIMPIRLALTQIVAMSILIYKANDINLSPEHEASNVTLAFLAFAVSKFEISTSFPGKLHRTTIPIICKVEKITPESR